MERFRRLSEEQLEQLLAGRAPADMELEALATALNDVPNAYHSTPISEVESLHLAAVMAEVRAVGDLSPQTAKRTTRALPRRKTMLAAIMGSLAAKIAVGAVAAAAATGGLAATGNLPEPAQGAVAAIVGPVVGLVGIDLDDAGEGTTTDAGEHGADVSETARTTDSTGREKGEQVADTAQTNSTEHRRDSDNPTGSTGEGQGNPAVPSGNPTGYGQDEQPSGNPTEYGQDEQPSGNPTEYGQDEQPSGNPTENGRP